MQTAWTCFFRSWSFRSLETRKIKFEKNVRKRPFKIPFILHHLMVVFFRMAKRKQKTSSENNLKIRKATISLCPYLLQNHIVWKIYNGSGQIKSSCFLCMPKLSYFLLLVHSQCWFYACTCSVEKTMFIWYW